MQGDLLSELISVFFFSRHLSASFPCTEQWGGCDCFFCGPAKINLNRNQTGLGRLGGSARWQAAELVCQSPTLSSTITAFSHKSPHRSHPWIFSSSLFSSMWRWNNVRFVALCLWRIHSVTRWWFTTPHFFFSKKRSEKKGFVWLFQKTIMTLFLRTFIWAKKALKWKSWSSPTPVAFFKAINSKYTACICSGLWNKHLWMNFETHTDKISHRCETQNSSLNRCALAGMQHDQFTLILPETHPTQLLIKTSHL